MRDNLNEKIMDKITATPKSLDTTLPVGLGSSLSSTQHNFDPVLLKDIKADDYKVDWIWEGFLAKGHMTMLSALWKSGKSTLLAGFIKDLQDNTTFCNKPTYKTKVLIISEESRTEWARRKEEFSINGEENVWLLPRPFNSRLNTKQWEWFLSKVSDFCTKYEVGLIIIDTLSTFWPVLDENNAAMVQTALIPFNGLLTKNISVLLVHHHRKGGGDQGQAARGSGVLGSTADILIDFERLQGDPQSTQRKLTCLSRFEETPRELVIEYSGSKYTALGTVGEVNKLEKHRNLLEILADYKEGVTAEEIRNGWDEDAYGKTPSTRTIRRHFEDMGYTGQVTSVKGAKPTDPTTYILAESAGQTRYNPYKDVQQVQVDKHDIVQQNSTMSNEKTSDQMSQEDLEKIFNP